MLASPQRNTISSSPSMETRCPSTNASVDSEADSRSAPAVSSTASSKGVELGARSNPTTNGKRGSPSSKRSTAHCRVATAACTISEVRSSVRLAGSGPSVLPSKSTSKRPAASIPVSHPSRVPQTRSRGASPNVPPGGFPIVTLMTASLSQTSTKPTVDSYTDNRWNPPMWPIGAKIPLNNKLPGTHNARPGNRFHTSAASTTDSHSPDKSTALIHFQQKQSPLQSPHGNRRPSSATSESERQSMQDHLHPPTRLTSFESTNGA